MLQYELSEIKQQFNLLFPLDEIQKYYNITYN